MYLSIIFLQSVAASTLKFIIINKRSLAIFNYVKNSLYFSNGQLLSVVDSCLSHWRFSDPETYKSYGWSEWMVKWALPQLNQVLLKEKDSIILPKPATMRSTKPELR